MPCSAMSCLVALHLEIILCFTMKVKGLSEDEVAVIRWSSKLSTFGRYMLLKDEDRDRGLGGHEGNTIGLHPCKEELTWERSRRNLEQIRIVLNMNVNVVVAIMSSARSPGHVPRVKY